MFTGACDELALTLPLKIYHHHIQDGGEVGKGLHDCDVVSVLIWLRVEFDELGVTQA